MGELAPRDGYTYLNKPGVNTNTGRETVMTRVVKGYRFEPAVSEWIPNEFKPDPDKWSDRNHWFGDDLDIHIESRYRRSSGGFTVINHHVMLIEHTKRGKLKNVTKFAIGIIIDEKGSETWGYGEAKFSKSFLKQTDYIYSLRAKLFDIPVMEKYWNFIISSNTEKKNRLQAVSSPHR